MCQAALHGCLPAITFRSAEQIAPGFGFGERNTPETNPLRETRFCVSPQPVLFPQKEKEKTHATRKTRHQTPGPA